MKKSTLNIIFAMCGIILGGLTFLFLAIPNASYASNVTGEAVVEWSGFQIFENGTTFFKVMLILTAIFSLFTLIFSLLSLVANTKCVESKLLKNLVNFGLLALSFLLVLFAILYLVSLVSLCSGGLFGYAQASPVFVTLVFMIIFSLVAFASALFILLPLNFTRTKAQK